MFATPARPWGRFGEAGMATGASSGVTYALIASLISSHCHAGNLSGHNFEIYYYPQQLFAMPPSKYKKPRRITRFLPVSPPATTLILRVRFFFALEGRGSYLIAGFQAIAILFAKIPQFFLEENCWASSSAQFML